MVQARQFRKSHEDAHYEAALFRYQRELAVRNRSDAIYVCMDDKHHIKVGEPKYPVAATVRSNESFEVADHDFTKFGIIPSVSFILDIPEDVSESWYDGCVFIAMKDAVFETSSPHRHGGPDHRLTYLSVQLSLISLFLKLDLDLFEILKREANPLLKPLLFIYSDGGPDHRLTYLSVQLSLVSLFLKLDLDFCVQ